MIAFPVWGLQQIAGPLNGKNSLPEKTPLFCRACLHKRGSDHLGNVCVRERESVCVYMCVLGRVCVCLHKRDSDHLGSVCVCEGERVCVYVCSGA